MSNVIIKDNLLTTDHILHTFHVITLKIIMKYTLVIL